MEDINPKHTIYIVQKSIVMNRKREVLLLKRSQQSHSRPLGWDFPGGSLQFGEDPKEGIMREIFEETGITLSNVEPIDVVSFLEGNEYTVMIGYYALAEKDQVHLSQEHSDYRWVSIKEFLQMDIPQEFKHFYNNSKR